MPHRRPLIPVVCALLERDGRVLVAQRPAHKHLPLKWEFPGGKVEAGEPPAVALVREMEEELHCRIVVVRPLPSSRHHYDELSIEMIPFLVQLAAGSPDPVAGEHAAIRWVEPHELSSLDLAAADLPVVNEYLAQRRPPAGPEPTLTAG